jgi:D-arginine utilization repressor
MAKRIGSEKLQHSSLIAFCKAICTLLSPHAEAVIHDLSTNTICHIENGFSKRSVGDVSDLEDFDPEEEASDVIGPYDKLNWNGRRLKCVSLVQRDVDGRAQALLCINLDVEDLRVGHDLLSKFLSLGEKARKPDSLFKNDLLDRMNEFVDAYTKAKGKRLISLSAADKHDLVLALRDTGAFQEKRAAEYLGKVLNVSRATIYNYLKKAEA